MASKEEHFTPEEEQYKKSFMETIDMFNFIGLQMKKRGIKKIGVLEIIEDNDIRLNDGVLIDEEAIIYKENGELFNKSDIPESLLKSNTYLNCAIVVKVEEDNCFLAYQEVKGFMVIDKKYLFVIKREYKE